MNEQRSALRRIRALGLLAVLSVIGVLGCASHHNATLSISCPPTEPRIYALGDDLGQRTDGASADRALYVYCGTSTSPVLSLSQYLEPYADGLDYDERGNVYVGEVANNAIRWLTFDPSGHLVVKSPPLQRFEDWAVNRVVGTLYVVTAPENCARGHGNCRVSAFLEAMAPSLNRVVRRIPLAFGASTDSVSNSPSGLTFDRRGHFYLKYGDHVFAFSLQSGRLIRGFSIGSGPWAVANDRLLVSNGTTLSEYGLHNFNLVRKFELLPQKTPYTKMTVAGDGTVYILDGKSLEMYIAGEPPSRIPSPFNGIDATLALDDQNDLYVLVPHNSSFSGNQIASTPGIYVYGPRGRHPIRIYKLPPLATTWSANTMIIVRSQDPMAHGSAPGGI